MKKEDSFWRVVKIMERLRGKEGCPWDREQTHHSLKPYLIEEAYEVLEAIEQDDPAKLREELGDLLLQVVFHAEIAQEDGEFDISDVLEGLAEKLVRRHPHVFGETRVETPQQVIEKWEAIKGQERDGKRSALSGIPESLPALFQARRLQEKASRVGFDWQEIAPVWEKVSEEWEELRQACVRGDKDGIAREFGDILFALVNLSRFLGIDAEEALKSCNKRFRERFQYIEERLRKDGLEPSKVDLETMDRYWEESKRRDK